MKNSKFTFFVLALLLAITTTFTAFSSVAIKTNADDNVQNYRLSEEIAKLTSIDSLDESPIGLYASVYWCGPYLQWTYQSLDGSADVGVVNYSKIQVSDSLSITPSGATAGINSVFSYTGNHSVGAAGCGDADRTWAISWTAPKTGVVTVKSGNLTIKGATNASDLSIGFSKGARTHIKPDDASLNWVNYPATVGETYPIADSSFCKCTAFIKCFNTYFRDTIWYYYTSNYFISKCRCANGSYRSIVQNNQIALRKWC